MRTPQTTLRAQDVQSYSQGLLKRHLRLADYSQAITARRVYAVLLYVAAMATTIATACRRLRGAPCDQSVYDALDETLPERLELQRRLNRALATTLPRALKRGRRRAKVAVDLTLLPYYGKPAANDDMVYKGQEKGSTHSHHAYATAYWVYKGRRFTLALRAVRHDEPWEEIVRSLLRQARKLVPGISLVLLDRGFYSVAVIRYLQRARYPFIMPLPCKGRKADEGQPAGGTRAFFAWKKSGWSAYTLEANKTRAQKAGKDLRARVEVAVKVRRKVPAARPGSKRRPARVLVYACWGLRHRDAARVDQAYQSRWVEWVKQTYRGRFGIESSYRQMNQGRGWTTSRSPARRLLLVGLALLLRNAWALLHLVALSSRPGGGGPRLRLELLPLPDLLDWLRLAIEQQLGRRDRLETEHAFTL
jgi:putative transposase